MPARASECAQPQVHSEQVEESRLYIGFAHESRSSVPYF